ncbi:hypothetical protein HELRODRAFT_92624 [Helobdella robusta]|uniref:Glycosyltransferase n=1 Tax=Helobdella robusta TaxID=6412 RepID=T1G8J0_HELRO|nr:hypothetical protein HELRODRAFT_92624 [Helobdella robusta]ESO00985.1 hypothetical protein HELRODRAFT_92624 [Helobdella robusta]
MALSVSTLDRLSSLERFVEEWPGPLGILLYVSEHDAYHNLDFIIRSSAILSRKDIVRRLDVHLVYKRDGHNPINYMRNVLLNNSFADYNFYIDIDLIPNKGAYRSLQNMIKSNGNSIFLLPAFKSEIYLDEKLFPKNKGELLKLIEKGSVNGIGVKSGWKLGHQPTNYSRWLTATEPYRAVFKDAFEPYVVAPKWLWARFNEDLMERMGDKIAYARLLHGLGFEFWVAPNDFIIHLPHILSAGTKKYWLYPDIYRFVSVC